MSTPANNLPSAPKKGGGLGGTVTIMGHKIPIVVLGGIGVALAIFIVLRMRSSGSGVAVGGQPVQDAYSGANAQQAQLDQLATNTSELQDLIASLNSQIAQGGQTTTTTAPYAPPLPEWQFGLGPSSKPLQDPSGKTWVWEYTQAAPSGSLAATMEGVVQPGTVAGPDFGGINAGGVAGALNSWWWSPVPAGMTAEEYAALLNNPGSDPSQLATYSPPVQQSSTAAPTLSTPVPAGGL